MAYKITSSSNRQVRTLRLSSDDNNDNDNNDMDSNTNSNSNSNANATNAADIDNIKNCCNIRIFSYTCTGLLSTFSQISIKEAITLTFGIPQYLCVTEFRCRILLGRTQFILPVIVNRWFWVIVCRIRKLVPAYFL